ncbi:uncharacterized protein LOC110429003 isoform X2 [Herrania umbratica]|uniref:Uncharacterized protein LOC110429003 isoform X2 n=1 Tax=Herrania umbratica TaxID=108875 RepID=A0A6J1BMB7_9ROSI|nr:uncharacterized protein LOC110429003 isoform X2 [Herrania umbratica]
MEESSSAAAGDQRDESTGQEVTIRGRDMDQESTSPETEVEARGLDGSESKPLLNKSDILKAVEVTSGSVDHMRCFGDAAGRLQESALDAATKGNRYINSCLRLNEEMKGIDGLASQLYPFQLSWCVLALHVKACRLLISAVYTMDLWTHPISLSPINVEAADALVHY